MLMNNNNNNNIILNSPHSHTHFHAHKSLFFTSENHLFQHERKCSILLARIKNQILDQINLFYTKLI